MRCCPLFVCAVEGPAINAAGDVNRTVFLPVRWFEVEKFDGCEEFKLFVVSLSPVSCVAASSIVTPDVAVTFSGSVFEPVLVDGKVLR